MLKTFHLLPLLLSFLLVIFSLNSWYLCREVRLSPVTVCQSISRMLATLLCQRFNTSTTCFILATTQHPGESREASRRDMLRLAEFSLSCPRPRVTHWQGWLRCQQQHGPVVNTHPDSERGKHSILFPSLACFSRIFWIFCWFNKSSCLCVEVDQLMLWSSVNYDRT